MGRCSIGVLSSASPPWVIRIASVFGETRFRHFTHLLDISKYWEGSILAFSLGSQVSSAPMSSVVLSPSLKGPFIISGSWKMEPWWCCRRWSQALHQHWNCVVTVSSAWHVVLLTSVNLWPILLSVHLSALGKVDFPLLPAAPEPSCPGASFCNLNMGLSDMLALVALTHNCMRRRACGTIKCSKFIFLHEVKWSEIGLPRPISENSSRIMMHLVRFLWSGPALPRAGPATMFWLK